MQLRSEFFNAFNMVNYGQPGRTLGGNNFGVVISAGDPCIIQFALKVIF